MMTQTMFACVALAATTLSANASTSADEVKAREVYEKIIAFRTAEGHAQTGPMVAYLEEVLTAGGVPTSDIAKITIGEATAMVVRVSGTSDRRPILFSAHMDIVDARPEEWERDPFKLVEENGTFYGRGTIDNKAGVTALVSTILRLKAERQRPQRTLLFGFVGDEETEMTTTKAIAAHEWVKNAEFAINTDAGGGVLDEHSGKPLLYLVQGAEKTYATFDLTVTNQGGHSARPRMDNAIYQLARAVLKVEGHRFPVMANDLTRSYLGALGKVQPGELGEALRRFAANPDDVAASDLLAKSPEFVGTTRTTCIATLLEAGHAENALPQTAKAAINCRIFPGVPVEQIHEELKTVVADPEVKVTVRGAPTASPVSEMRPDVMKAITRAVHAQYPSVPIVPYLESGGTDGKWYRIAGIPTFASSGLFTKESEMLAHGLNERLPVRAFYEGLEHVYQLAVELGGARRAR